MTVGAAVGVVGRRQATMCRVRELKRSRARRTGLRPTRTTRELLLILGFCIEEGAKVPAPQRQVEPHVTPEAAVCPYAAWLFLVGPM